MNAIEVRDLRKNYGAGTTAKIVADGGSAVVVLTTYETDADILRAVEAGASGYLLKDASTKELAEAVRAAGRGETVLAPSVAGKLVRSVRTPASRHFPFGSGTFSTWSGRA